MPNGTRVLYVDIDGCLTGQKYSNLHREQACDHTNQNRIFDKKFGIYTFEYPDSITKANPIFIQHVTKDAYNYKKTIMRSASSRCSV